MQSKPRNGLAAEEDVLVWYVNVHRASRGRRFAVNSLAWGLSCPSCLRNDVIRSLDCCCFGILPYFAPAKQVHYMVTKRQQQSVATPEQQFGLNDDDGVDDTAIQR